MPKLCKVGPAPSASALSRVFFGLGLLALGQVLVNAAAALAPIWIMELASGALILAGISLLLETLRQKRPARIFSFALVPVLAVKAYWALSDGAGRCKTGLAMPGLVRMETASTQACLSAALVSGGALACAVLIAGLVVVLRRLRRMRA